MRDDVCCGRCSYHKCDNETGLWYCDNDVSYEYSCETEYEHSCNDFEER